MTTKWNEVFGDEWVWVCTLRKSYHDPQEREVFWESVCEKKLANPAYRVEHDFPRDKMPAVDPARATEAVAKRICREILIQLTSSRQDHRKEAPGRAQTEFEREMGELIDIGAHNAPLCPWPPKEKRRGA